MKTMKRMTENRRQVIEILSNQDYEGNYPPFRVETIQSEIYMQFDRMVLPKQIYRTCADLVAEGTVGYYPRLIDVANKALPSRVKFFFTFETVDRFILLNEVYDFLDRIKGFTFFVDQNNKQFVIGKLRSFIQRTHPDKVAGYEYENTLLIAEFTRIKFL